MQEGSSATNSFTAPKQTSSESGFGPHPRLFRSRRRRRFLEQLTEEEVKGAVCEKLYFFFSWSRTQESSPTTNLFHKKSLKAVVFQTKSELSQQVNSRVDFAGGKIWNFEAFHRRSLWFTRRCESCRKRLKPEVRWSDRKEAFSGLEIFLWTRSFAGFRKQQVIDPAGDGRGEAVRAGQRKAGPGNFFREGARLVQVGLHLEWELGKN